jgi:hypothetical protein
MPRLKSLSLQKTLAGGAMQRVSTTTEPNLHQTASDKLARH